MAIHKLEVFARRDRAGWTCIGNEAPGTAGEAQGPEEEEVSGATTIDGRTTNEE